MTRHLPNEHKNSQEHANIVQKFSMTLSLNLVTVQQGVFLRFTLFINKEGDDDDDMFIALGGGEGHCQKNWVEVCGPLPKTLTLF